VFKYVFGEVNSIVLILDRTSIGCFNWMLNRYIVIMDIAECSLTCANVTDCCVKMEKMESLVLLWIYFIAIINDKSYCSFFVKL
jgi:hypothetical protein